MQDDVEQAARATEVIEGTLGQRSPGFVSTIVLAELAWVLSRAYRYRRGQIAAGLDLLLSVGVLRFEHQDAVYRALARYRAGPLGFADALLLEVALAQGTTGLLTFDAAFADTPQARVL